jgi:uncharacterized membrane protein YhaH (DUF805 family)
MTENDMTPRDQPTGDDDPRRCPNCGVENPAAALRCECGFDLRANGNRTPRGEQRNGVGVPAAAPAGPITELFMLSGRLSRRPYFVTGAVLVAIKYAGDAWLSYHYNGTGWSPLAYVTRTGFLQMPPAFQLAMLLWTLPFLWVGLALTLRRTVDAAITPWAAMLYFVPIVNYVYILFLCVSPTQPERPRAPPSARLGTDDMTTSIITCVGASLLIALVAIGFHVYWLRQYGTGLFLGAPVVMGAVSAYLLNRRRMFSLPVTISVSMMATVLSGTSVLFFGIEGVVCLMMAAPVALVGSVLGALVGHVVASHRVAGYQAWLVVLGLPLLSGFDAQHGAPGRWQVDSSIEIDTTPVRVWPHVIGFTDLPPPSEFVLATGLAYPQGAHIEGSGVGSVRYCEFSTGPFVEPITRWEPPSRLSFDVAQQPVPMREWSPYREVHPPHLDGYFRSVAGEFRLTPLPGGRTRLEGTTWYELDLAPASYWTIWSDMLIHAIHLRVLEHIKHLAESR